MTINEMIEKLHELKALFNISGKEEIVTLTDAQKFGIVRNVEIYSKSTPEGVKSVIGLDIP